MPIAGTDTLLYSVVRLESLRKGQTTGTGTGFLWAAPLGNDESALVIITNKHVLAGADCVNFQLHEADDAGTSPSGNLFGFEVEINDSNFCPHPGNVDLCAINISGIFVQCRDAGLNLFWKHMGAGLIPPSWDNFDAIEEVTMLGCPRGLYDSQNNVPLSRRGITASPLHLRYEGKEEFMVDMACFPGSSGSPVFVINRFGHFDKTENRYKIGEGRFFLVGVLYAGPLITNTGRIVMSQEPSVEVAAMMHLGQVIRATELHVLDAAIATKWRAS